MTSSDLLDAAFEALRQTEIPDGPSGELIADLMDSMEQQAVRAVCCPSRFKKGYSMQSIIKIAAIGILLVAGFSVRDWQSTGDNAQAFDKVARKLEQIHSASCQVTTDAAGRTFTARVLLLAPSLERIETRVADEITSIHVSDFRTGRLLSALPQNRSAGSDAIADPVEDRPAHGSLEQFRERLRHAQSEGAGAWSLGKQDMDGVQAVGFRLLDRTGTTDVWANAKTALPVRVETTSSGDQATKVVMTDFEFNIDLNESAFQLTPPTGFALRESTIDASSPSIEDLRDMLKFCAENNDGVFPEQLVGNKGAESVVQKLMQDLESQHDPGSSEWQLAMTEYSGQIARGTAFVTLEQPASQWHYSGQGVKIGDADRVIFWCRHPHSERYQVLRGDLKIHR